MAGKNDDAVSIREDAFLGRLVPQVADHLAGQHEAGFDAETSQARFHAWLTEHADRSDDPDQASGEAREPSVPGAEVEASTPQPLEQGTIRALGDYARNAIETVHPPQPPQSDHLVSEKRGVIKIGMWGATASGKTTFLAALRQAVDTDPANGHWNIYPDDHASADFMVQLTHTLVSNGQFPEATMPGTETELRWRFVGDLAGSRFDRRKLRRRAPMPSEFTLSLSDISGRAFGDPGSSGGPPQMTDRAIEHLANAQGLLYFFDPISENHSGNSMESLNGTIIELSRRMLADNRLANVYLPHQVSVCITKFDHPDVFRQAQRHGLVSLDQDGRPHVLDKDAKTLFNMICDGSFWGERYEYQRSGSLLVRDELRRRFHPDRIRYFVTSSIGFFTHLERDPALGRQAHRFNPDDFANLVSHEEREMIRGAIAPVNVIEPLLSLQQRISGTARIRALRAVPSEHTERSSRRLA